MSVDLTYIGLENLKHIDHNPTTPRLYQKIVQRGEGSISHLGPVVVNTGKYTGRSPDDKFIVREPSSEQDVWWGEINHPMEEGPFDALLARVRAYLQGRDVFVQDCYAGIDSQYRVPLRIITELAWHSLLARNLFVRERYPHPQVDEGFEPAWNLICAPGFRAVPGQDHTRSEVFIVIHLARRLIVIGGTHYGGEIKKAIFTILNHIFPKQGILSMHSSANMSKQGETAVFFGLSGTGKTTLSASGDLTLIGDDEHGWGPEGVFNFEGGCYAKVLNLSEEEEPEIYATTRRFGTVLENVAIDAQTLRVDLNDSRFTQNTRASYPLSHIPNAKYEGHGGHPRNIIMLTCDAFGLLPPVARLTREQAMYHFISGYTSKVPGTERGIQAPTATFSPCFGAPFMTLSPAVYARLLGENITRHATQCWLVNTGWHGGGFGEGERIRIAQSKAVVAGILDGKLDRVPCRRHPLFGLDIPEACPGVRSELLDLRNMWKDAHAYDVEAKNLIRLFDENFAAYEAQTPELKAARLGSA